MVNRQNPDTEMSPGPDRFPATPWSAILRSGGGDPAVRREALHRLLALYWRPIYAYVRRKWGKSNEDAKDLTQEFIASIIEKDLFAGADRERGRFRALLRKALENFLRNRYAEGRAQRRGGDRKIVSLDLTMESDGDVPVSEEAPPDEAFRLEWMRTIFSAAVEELRRGYAAEGKDVYMQVFDRYQLSGDEEVSYESVARALKLKIWDVTNHLADARRRLRDIIQRRVREYCLSDEDFRDEIADLLGNGR